jgi:hypothetical protein
MELNTMLEAVFQDSFTPTIEEIDHARAQEYALLATLLWRSPDSMLLSRLADLRDDASPIGVAHGAVREAAGRVDGAKAARNILPCLPASERIRSCPIRLTIWRRRYTDARYIVPATALQFYFGRGRLRPSISRKATWQNSIQDRRLSRAVRRKVISRLDLF